MTEEDLYIDEPSSHQPLTTLILAHGAGAGMDTPFLETFAEGLSSQNIRVVRFEFPYMLQRRQTGKKRGPNPQAVLEQSWREALQAVGSPSKLFIGGKSMGGRIASQIADEVGVKGLICLGYPFHPPGKPHQLRTRHLKSLSTPALILQGERDPFGKREEVENYHLSEEVQVEWIPDGDHSFKPRKKSGRSEQQNLELGISKVHNFLQKVGLKTE